MSDLQIILIVIGVLIIVAVIMVNWWQEKRFHKQMQNNFLPLENDALSNDEPYISEPKFDSLASKHSVKSKASFDEHITSSSKHKFSQDEDFPFDVHAIKESASKVSAEPALKINRAEAQETTDKSTQHHDIKAIFKDIFNKSGKSENTENEALADITLASKTHSTLTSEAIKDEQKIVAEVNTAPAGVNPSQQGFTRDNISEGVQSDSTKSSTNEQGITLPAMLHGQIDLTAILYLAQDTELNTLFDAFVNLLEGYDKTVFVHLQPASNDELSVANKTWFLLKEAAPQAYSRIACSLQMADRSGPVSRTLLNRFQLAVESIGLDINAHVEWQNTGDALTQAKVLDEFCMEVDKTIGFHLLHGANGPFTGTKLKGLAEAQGFKLADDGLFKYFDANTSEPAFVMFNRDDHPFSIDMLRASVIKSVTFQFDIPHIKQCTEIFNKMVQVARQMEIGLNAQLVDESNKTLGDIQIEKIRQQLKAIQATMLMRGIMPGAESTLRLFS